MLHGVLRSAHEWGVDDSEDVARLNFCHPNKGKDLSPRGDKVFYSGQSDRGSMSTR